MEQNLKAETSPKQSKKVKGETVRELTHRHLMDATHVTTDEELRNVQLELHNPQDPIELSDTDSERSESTTSEDRLLNKGSVIVSPWDAVK